MKNARIPLRTYNPDRDKVARAYSVQGMLERGMVYIPDRKWAHELVGYLGSFPNGEPISNDYTDTFTQALIYISSGLYVEPLVGDDKKSMDDYEERNYAEYRKKTLATAKSDKGYNDDIKAGDKFAISVNESSYG